MSYLVRKNPPPIDYGRKRAHELTEWNAVLQQALRAPGVWFMVREPYSTARAAANAAHDLKHGRKLNIPDGRWDAQARESFLYVKYLGG